MMSSSTTWNDLIYPGNADDFFARQSFPAFNPDATGYSRDNARWLMELCRLVYRHDIEETDHPPQPTRNSFLTNAGFRQRKFVFSNVSNTQAMLLESTMHTPYAVLVFRGTEQNSGDLKTDIKVWKNFFTALKATLPLLNRNQVLVHQGFKEALDSPTQNQTSVWDEILTELLQLDCPVFYTGHSLGAALATLAAVRHAPQAVYTFGSPRVGNLAFANTLINVPIYRVVDNKDIVTTLPPDEFGFVHTGEEQRLISPQSNSMFGWLKYFDAPPTRLADHAPINYVDRI